MSHFFRNGNTFRVADDKAIEVHEFLPAGNYIVKIDPFENFFLEEVEQFKPIKKVYGDALKNADRILNTFDSREMSTGVLLNGEKGSGKTLLAKTLSIEAGNKGIPTIIINTDWHGDKFNKLIQDINQPAIIMFDEFEKVYGEETQEAVLTLMDGVFPTKKLFVLTCNDKWRINSHMRNRPGRLYYMIDYKGLDHAFIIEYCQDNLNAKQYIEKICTIASMFDQFNFDMLKALVEEMNRYDESPADALRILNAKPEFDSGSKYSVEVTFEGEKITELRRDEWKGNPLNDDVCFSFFFKSKKTKPVVKGTKGKIKSTLAPALTAAIDDDEDGDRWIDLTFKPNDLYQVFPQEGRYIFRNSQAEAVLTKKVETFYDWRAL